MSCELSLEKLNAFFDGELPPPEEREAVRHVAACADCSRAIDKMTTLRAALRQEFDAVVPAGLAAKISGSLPAPLAPRFAWASGLARQAASFLLVGLLATGATYSYLSTRTNGDQLTHDLVAAHARAMMQDQPFQVASSDQHTVKPWFNGRTDFSPEVKDFADKGYALAGGRLDYINGKRVAALVYRHGNHLIDVFLWPSKDDRDPVFTTRDGYQLASWAEDGMEGHCVSDIGPAEMKAFAALLYGKT